MAMAPSDSSIHDARQGVGTDRQVGRYPSIAVEQEQSLLHDLAASHPGIDEGHVHALNAPDLAAMGIEEPDRSGSLAAP